jgi:LacI family transcriptional regulator
MSTEITLKQISRLSGFSISTVSKALNDKLDVSNKTKVKIQGLARDNNYIPNNTAVALRKRKTNIIGVIVPEINARIYGILVSKIQEMAFKKGYRLLLLQSFSCEVKELQCINNVKDGCVDGVIMIKSYQNNGYFNRNQYLSTNSNAIPTVIKEIDESNLNLDEGYTLGEKLINKLLHEITR